MRRFLLLIKIFFFLTQPSEAAQNIRYFRQQENSQVSNTPYGLNDQAGHYVKAGDAKIYYEIYGTGKPCFIFHGGAVGSPYEMGLIIDELRKDFQVIVVSTRGHGRSELGKNPLSYEQKAKDMHYVMQKVTDKPALLLGFSDGAYTAFKLASDYPSKVERLVAIGAGTLKAGFFPNDLTLADLRKLDPDYVKQMQKISPEPERLQEFLSAYMAFWHKMSLGKEVLGHIQCPTLLIVGDSDDHAPVPTVVEAKQMLPNSRLCVVPKAWHTAFLDNWPVTWACLRQFIKADQKSLSPAKNLQ